MTSFLEAGPPPGVFTLGSAVVSVAGVEKFYEESAAAAAQLGQRAVLLVGRHLRHHLQDRLPAGVIAIDQALHAAELRRLLDEPRYAARRPRWNGPLLITWSATGSVSVSIVILAAGKAEEYRRVLAVQIATLMYGTGQSAYSHPTRGGIARTKPTGLATAPPAGSDKPAPVITTTSTSGTRD